MAKTKYKVEVTAADIKKGLRYFKKYGSLGLASKCPVALAIQRATKDNTVSTSHFSALINGRFVDLPVRASKFIDTFDSYLPVKPFSFTLSV